MGRLDGPKQIILVSAREEVEVMGKEIPKEDLVAVSWHMPVSLNPMFYAVALFKDEFALEVIRKSNSFVVNFMPYTAKEAVLFCARHSGEHIDKFKETELTKEEAEKIDAPRVKEAVAYLECELSHEYIIGDHFLLIGKVLYSDIKSEEKRIFQLDNIGEYTTTSD